MSRASGGGGGGEWSIYILLHDWEGNIQFEGDSIGPTAGRLRTEYCPTQRGMQFII